MRLRVAAAVCAASLSFVVLYGHVIARLARDWMTDGDYSHGFLVAPVAAYLVWKRRERLARATPRPSVVGLLAIGGSLLVLLAGVLGAELFLTRVAMIGTLAGAVLFVFGWEHLRVLLFPLAFTLLMIPVPALILNEVAGPLQGLAARAGESLLLTCGVPVVREGNVIVLAHTSLEVAEACSGIRSLVSLFALAIVYGHFSDSRASMRLAIVASTVPVAVLANGVRVAGTGLAAHHFGVETALGFFHTFSGWLLFLVAFLLIFAWHRLLATLVRRGKYWRGAPVSWAA